MTVTITVTVTTNTTSQGEGNRNAREDGNIREDRKEDYDTRGAPDSILVIENEGTSRSVMALISRILSCATMDFSLQRIMGMCGVL
jgi:hypothetical protein